MPHEICTITECGECVAERIEKYEALVQAAAALICSSRTERYKSGSKKAALRDALEALKS